MGKIKKINDFELIEPEPYTSRRAQRKRKIFEEEKKYHINFVPKTKNQQIAWQYFHEKPIVVLTGSAGSGKTMMATAYACDQITKGNYERLIITRNAIGCGKSIGFFPGDIQEKMGSWLQQVLSFCREFVGVGVVDTWMRGETPKIIMEPTEVVRGRSYCNSVVLVEEAQQLSIEEIKCLVTRVGQGSILIMTGDSKQRDIREDGLERFCNLVEKHNIDGVGVVKFTPDDILRSDIVKELILAFEKEGL